MDFNKLVKLQADVMKWLHRKQSWKDARKYLYSVDDESGVVYLIIGGTRIVNIPKSLWYLNIETVFDGIEPMKVENIRKMYADARADAVMLTDTQMSKKAGEKKEVECYENPTTKEHIFFDKDLLKDFDFTGGFYLCGNKPKCPAIVKDDVNGLECGLILPVNMG